MMDRVPETWVLEVDRVPETRVSARILEVPQRNGILKDLTIIFFIFYQIFAAYI